MKRSRGGNKVSTALLSALLATALASCSSVNASLPFAAAAGSPASAAADRGESGIVLFRIAVPKGSRNVRVPTIRKGHPAYVSASTKAMKIVAQNGSKKTTIVVPLTPASPGCTTGPAGTTCTAKVVLPVCGANGKCYTALVSTYDNVFCNGAPPVCSVPANANELSAGQSVPFRVATGKNNTVSLTLSGVPHSMTVSPDTLTRANGSAFDLIGPGAHAFTGQTYDVDGNAIVGAGSPSFAASSPTGGLAVTVTAPPSAPSQIWVAPPATLDTTDTATFQMSPTFAGQSIDGCKLPGANCAPVSVTVDMVPMAAMLGFLGVLSFYALDEQTPRASLTGMKSTGYGLQADATGDIFTPNGVVTAYTPPFSAGNMSRPACCPGNGTVMATGASVDGKAAFLSYYASAVGQQNAVSVCSPSSCSTMAYILSYNAHQVFASNAEGDFLYGNPGTPGPGVTNCFASVYPASNYRAPVVLSAPMKTTDCAHYVALDPSGDAFVSDEDDNQIVEYSKSSAYQTATFIKTGSGTPVVAMLLDSSGNLYDFVNVTVVSSYEPYIFNSYLVLQETLASSLSTSQGGSLSPDRTASYPTGQAQFANAEVAFGPGGIYATVGGLSLVEYELPSLSIVELAATPQSQATGLLVLP